MKLLKKKNSEYSSKERKETAIMAFVLFGFIGLILCFNSNWFQFFNAEIKCIPYFFGVTIGLLTAVFTFKFPKYFRILIFILPLFIFGS